MFLFFLRFIWKFQNYSLFLQQKYLYDSYKLLVKEDMEKNDYQTALSLKKMEFISQIVSETSLDTLSSWMDMYEEARYVASLNSTEEELKEFQARFNESIKKGLFKNKSMSCDSHND